VTATASHRRPYAALAIALALGCLAALISGTAFDRLPRPRPLEELAYYPSGQHLKPAVLGHGETAADLAWLRAVQYYGEHRRTDNRFTQMSHVFDILTSLAPDFVPAYVFGAFALAQEGRDFPAAERLMLKGIAANPTSGELAFELGFLYYVRPGGRELNRAAEYFEQAARQPDAPPSAARFAAFARQHSGNLMVAYELWSEVLRQSPNPYLRETAEHEMARIRSALRQGRPNLAERKLATPAVLLQPGP
jgi:tetratricopeptide (TPR) repeat protein